MTIGIPRQASVSQVAQAAGVSPRAIRALCERGRIKLARKIGGVWVIPVNPDGLPELLKNRELRGVRSQLEQSRL